MKEEVKKPQSIEQRNCSGALLVSDILNLTILDKHINKEKGKEKINLFPSYRVAGI